MWSKVDNYIKRHNLLNASDLYIIALSGGADSVALLLLLHEAGYNVHAAHCNFHLRGEESDRDERFCEELCRRLCIPFHRAHFDTQTYAELHKVSIEMAARELRYRWFGQLRMDIGAAGVCVAHHRDDSVETVLLNLVRGTGLRGLTGIQARTEIMVTCGPKPMEQHNLVVVRPLLCVSRQEIESYLRQRGQEYVTDSTNLEADVLRNKVRLQVLPLLKTLNPAVAENVRRTAENLAEAQQILDCLSSKYDNNNVLELSEFKKYNSTEYFIYEWAKKYGFNGKQIAQIQSAETGSVFTSNTGYDLLVDRGRLLVEPSLKPIKSIRIPEEGTYILDENHTFKVRKCAVYVSKTARLATLDAAKVVFPLTVRRVEQGDWMVPYGMKGRKLLSDLMTDCKMNLFEKRRQLVVVDARGAVVWTVGLRTDARVAVSDATQEVLEMELCDF